jgi:hypothetical protein
MKFDTNTNAVVRVLVAWSSECKRQEAKCERDRKAGEHVERKDWRVNPMRYTLLRASSLEFMECASEHPCVRAPTTRKLSGHGRNATHVGRHHSSNDPKNCASTQSCWGSLRKSVWNHICSPGKARVYRYVRSLDLTGGCMRNARSVSPSATNET